MADAPSKRSWKDLADFDLSVPEDALALVERFQGEWYNGSLSQLFANWNRADIVLIPEALRIVGAPEAAPIVEAAIAEFPGDQDDWRELAQELVRSLSGEVTGEDVRLACERDGIVPHHHNAWGAAVARMVRLKYLVPTGEWVPMTGNRSNGRRTPMYRMVRP